MKCVSNHCRPQRAAAAGRPTGSFHRGMIRATTSSAGSSWGWPKEVDGSSKHTGKHMTNLHVLLSGGESSYSAPLEKEDICDPHLIIKGYYATVNTIMIVVLSFGDGYTFWELRQRSPKDAEVQQEEC